MTKDQGWSDIIELIDYPRVLYIDRSRPDRGSVSDGIMVTTLNHISHRILIKILILQSSMIPTALLKSANEY